MELLNSLILGEGRPLVILHGFLGMLDNWKTLGAKYAEKGFEVHLLDHRNHGRSFHSEKFSYELMAGDIIRYANAKSLGVFSVLGHSMGGKAAMLLAVTYPNRVERLIVADISPRYYPPHHQEILAGLDALYQVEPNSRAEAEAILSKYVSLASVRMFLMKNLRRDQNSNELKLCINLPVLTREVDAIGKPIENGNYDGKTLFIRGGNSQYVDDKDFLEIKKMFPHSELKTIDGASHWLHADNPREFMRLSLEFLGQS